MKRYKMEFYKEIADEDKEVAFLRRHQLLDEEQTIA